MTEPSAAASQFSPRTAWARRLETPLRQFVRTETGSAAVLLAATLAALAWANINPSGYDATWRTEFSIRLGSYGLDADLREWVNSGLMAFFFLVAGLEARREFDMGELRVRVRLALPLVVGLGGMIVPIGIYLALNAGRASASGWGTAMSTDTAFALGLLALVGRNAPGPGRHLPADLRDRRRRGRDRDHRAGLQRPHRSHRARDRAGPHRPGPRRPRPAASAAAPPTCCSGWRPGRRSSNPGSTRCWSASSWAWLALAYPATRIDLERASTSFRLFREQPTPDLARDAQESVRTAISPNDRLQQIFHPWTSYLIVPLFALANAGITISGASWPARSRRRSRSGSCSATCWESRPAPSARRGC